MKADATSGQHEQVEILQQSISNLSQPRNFRGLGFGIMGLSFRTMNHHIPYIIPIYFPLDLQGIIFAACWVIMCCCLQYGSFPNRVTQM